MLKEGINCGNSVRLGRRDYRRKKRDRVSIRLACFFRLPGGIYAPGNFLHLEIAPVRRTEQHGLLWRYNKFGRADRTDKRVKIYAILPPQQGLAPFGTGQFDDGKGEIVGAVTFSVHTPVIPTDQDTVNDDLFATALEFTLMDHHFLRPVSRDIVECLNLCRRYEVTNDRFL